MKTNKLLVIVLAGAGLFGLLAMLSLRGARNAEAENLADLVIAKVEIPLGTVLTADHVEKVQIMKTASPELAFTKPEDLVGRVSINAIGPREPLTEYRLAPKGSLAGLAAKVPDGYRALTVKVDDEAGVAGLLAPDMTVDVISVIRFDQGGRDTTTAKVVLQNIKVLATGQNMASPKEQVTAESVKSITLLVTPAEAEKCVMASHETRLRLIVRNMGDTTSASTSGIRNMDMLQGDQVQGIPKPENQMMEGQGNYAPAPRPRRIRTASNPVAEPNQAPPVAPAPRVDTIEVYHGSKRTEVVFPK
ncbi:MAG: Flp pilus assembly protein CpaB [Acidobacteria bacterium]|nr:Flp pilus assembly protein CpaB [Acidobacteriota bacterium]